MKNWVSEELRTIDLGDARLNKRSKRLLATLARQPQQSITAACDGWKEQHAAYQFFSNDKVTAAKILEPHFEATRQRVQQLPTVLCVEDTTFLNYQGQKDNIKGLGPHTSGQEHGLSLHPMVAFSPQRNCLGVIRSHSWVKDALLDKKKSRPYRAIEQKESYRWLEGIRQVAQLQEQYPQTRFVYVTDRESDIYDVLQEGVQGAGSFVIRSSVNRQTEMGSRVLEQLAQSPVLGRTEIEIGARPGRPARKARLKIRALRLRLQPPGGRQDGSKLQPIELSVVAAEESRPPGKQKPIRWVLFTDLEVNDLDQAVEKLSWYCCRWQIEIYFRVLKEGCRVEALQLESRERLEKAIALYQIIAWRVLHVLHSARQNPELGAEMLFSAQEWKTVYRLVKRQRPPSKPPSAWTVVKLIAALGGYPNLPKSPPPGAKRFWSGLTSLHQTLLHLETLSKT